MKISGELQGLDGVKRALRELGAKDVRFATVVGLNRLAFGVREAWAKKADEVFDRPVSLTKKAAQYTKATLTEPTAEIKLRDDAFKGTPPVKYLAPEVYGGGRGLKRFERWLQAKGLMPVGTYAVPGAGVRLDAYGNVSAGTITKILSALGANPDALSNATPTSTARRRRKRRRGGEYFAVTVRRGRLVPGVYERFGFGFGSAVKPILIFVRAPRYAARYTVYDAANAYLEANRNPVMNQALDEAVLSNLARNTVSG